MQQERDQALACAAVLEGGKAGGNKDAAEALATLLGTHTLPPRSVGPRA